MDALVSAIGLGPHRRLVYDQVHSALAEDDVQKTLEKWVAASYSEEAEEDVRTGNVRLNLWFGGCQRWTPGFAFHTLPFEAIRHNTIMFFGHKRYSKTVSYS